MDTAMIAAAFPAIDCAGRAAPGAPVGCLVVRICMGSFCTVGDLDAVTKSYTSSEAPTLLSIISDTVISLPHQTIQCHPHQFVHSSSQTSSKSEQRPPHQTLRLVSVTLLRQPTILNPHPSTLLQNLLLPNRPLLPQLPLNIPNRHKRPHRRPRKRKTPPHHKSRLMLNRKNQYGRHNRTPFRSKGPKHTQTA